MKSLIRWIIDQTPAVNTLIVGILLVGLVSAMGLRREEFPEFELEIILVTVPYPGASPDEVESGICLKIEEAIRSINGIKKVTSVATEGTGTVVIEVRTDGPTVQKVLNDIEAEIDRIPSFPELAEEPEIRQLTLRDPAIMVGIVGEESSAVDAELRLREMTELVRDDLLSIKEISTAEIQGERDYQIDVEVPEKRLREYGLSLKEVATRIRLQNLELPGGSIKGETQEFLLRGKNKRLKGSEIAEIPLVTKANGVVLTVGDIGTVHDEFVDTTSISRINGQPGMAISVEAASQEDLLAMTAAVRKYVQEKKLPAGYQLQIWNDNSIDVEDRLNLLVTNGLQGLVLVFITLALFLDLRLSFWVAFGIPVSLLGCCAILWLTGDTLNMLSMFSFLIALGIVVDDAIVVSENIHSHHEQGKSYHDAAVDGAAEVVPSVCASMLTTVFAFMPMFFVSGIMGKFFAVMPLTVIAILGVSLFESLTSLPCHLAHFKEYDPEALTPFQRARLWRRSSGSPIVRYLFAPMCIVLTMVWEFFAYPLRRTASGVHWCSEHFGWGLDWFIEKVYSPFIKVCLKSPWMVCACSFSFLLVSMTLVTNGTVPWVIFPKLDGRNIEAIVIFPDGTPKSVTDEATLKLERGIRTVCDRYEKEKGEDVLELTFRLVGQVRTRSPGGNDARTEGGHAGTVSAALTSSERRTIDSLRIIEDWRKEVGTIPGAETLTFDSVSMGPGGKAIEFKLLATGEHMKELEAAVETCKDRLAVYPGVYDITDDSRPGKWEIQLRVKEKAKALGIPLEDVAQTVRSAYYGQEVMRLQRGRHEVKLMVRYPEEERRSLVDFNDLRVDSPDGIKRPLTELADITMERSYSEINRIDQKRSITVSANVDETRANAALIVREMETFLATLQNEHPNLRVRWEGQAEQTAESIGSLFIGQMVALLATFVLLTLQFRSYLQPMIIMLSIPFGMIGAILGHAVMGLPLTLFSVLGMVALSGIVVNDSIVLVDFINAELARGVPLRVAVAESGRRRFRAVMLTSLTTIAGMMPLLLERSMQAQLLIPMATSLCFGLMMTTVLVLVLVPVFYQIYGSFFLKPEVIAGLPALRNEENPETEESEPDSRTALVG